MPRSNPQQFRSFSRSSAERRRHKTSYRRDRFTPCPPIRLLRSPFPAARLVHLWESRVVRTDDLTHCALLAPYPSSWPCLLRRSECWKHCYNYKNPVRRDVVNSGSSTDDDVVIRFETNNAGPWIMHWYVNLFFYYEQVCLPAFRSHIDWHLDRSVICFQKCNKLYWRLCISVVSLLWWLRTLKGFRSCTLPVTHSRFISLFYLNPILFSDMG